MIYHLLLLFRVINISQIPKVGNTANLYTALNDFHWLFIDVFRKFVITDRRKQRKFNLLSKRNFFFLVKWIQKVSSREKLPFVSNELSIDSKMRPNKRFELWLIKGHLRGQQFYVTKFSFPKKKSWK